MALEEPTWIDISENGVMVEVLVVPASSRTRVMGTQDNRLIIQLNSKDDDDAVNRALVQFLADSLGISRVQIEIVGGASNSRKRVAVSRITRNQVLLKLSPRA